MISGDPRSELMCFIQNLVVLVNDSPTYEIKIQRGLKLGDPLAYFLFLLMAEGLSGLINNATKLSIFSRFKVGSSNLEISHLQYTDDTLIYGDPSVDNV